MDELHIFTVGVSILLNFGKSCYKEEFESLSEWYKLPPDSPQQQKFVSWAKKGEKVFDKVLEFVNKDPRKASAELNAYYRFESLMGKAEREFILYATDTGTGLFCARILKAHLEDKGYKVREPITLKGFGLGYEFFDEALASVMDSIAKTLSKTGVKVYLNATGGFKPETTFAVISALLYGVRGIYYVHESFQDIVILPAPPLQINSKYLDELKQIGIEGKQKYILIDVLGWDEHKINELIERQLVELRSGKIMLRKWVKPLLQNILEG